MYGRVPSLSTETITVLLVNQLDRYGLKGFKRKKKDVNFFFFFWLSGLDHPASGQSRKGYSY